MAVKQNHDIDTAENALEESSATLISSKPSAKTPAHPIPQISSDRLRSAAHDKPLNVDALLHEKDGHKKSEKTILYLAYGSNMSSETFRKTRGIVPLSQINALVPDLCLTFDLPGFPYLEPCFAGTQYRDPGTGLPSMPQSSSSPSSTPLLDETKHKTWLKPLVGIVYEVTLSDYAHIIATEGAGSSYIDITVDCYPFAEGYDPTSPVPSTPSTSPFKAHTLLSPQSDNSPRRPRGSTHAQPSARYKGLLVNGAAEHDLPHEYRAYLSSITPYTITSPRQWFGRILLAMVYAPFILLALGLSSVLADKRGHSPAWLKWVQGALFSNMWWTYDHVFKRVFGDGERTMGKSGNGKGLNGGIINGKIDKS